MAESRAGISQAWGTGVLGLWPWVGWSLSFLALFQAGQTPGETQAGPVSSCDRKASRDFLS